MAAFGIYLVYYRIQQREMDGEAYGSVGILSGSHSGELSGTGCGKQTILLDHGRPGGDV